MCRHGRAAVFSISTLLTKQVWAGLQRENETFIQKGSVWRPCGGQEGLWTERVRASARHTAILFCLNHASACLLCIPPDSSLFVIQRFWNGFISSALRPCLSTVRWSVSKPEAWVVKPTTSKVGGRWTCILSDSLELVWATMVWLTGWPFQVLILLPVCCPDGTKEYFCYTLLTHPWNTGDRFDQFTRELSTMSGSILPEHCRRAYPAFSTGG